MPTLFILLSAAASVWNWLEGRSVCHCAVVSTHIRGCVGAQRLAFEFLMSLYFISVAKAKQFKQIWHCSSIFLLFLLYCEERLWASASHTHTQKYCFPIFALNMLFSTSPSPESTAQAAASLWEQWTEDPLVLMTESVKSCADSLFFSRLSGHMTRHLSVKNSSFPDEIITIIIIICVIVLVIKL